MLPTKSIHLHFSGSSGNHYSFNKISLKTNRSTTNLKILFERKKGEIFSVDSKGVLQKVGWKEWFPYLWDKKREREKVKKVIDKTLTRFETFLSKSTESEEKKKAAVNHLFNKEGKLGIGRLGQSLYTHEKINSDTPLSKYLLPPDTVRIQLGDKKFVDLKDSSFENFPLPFPLNFDLGDSVSNFNFQQLALREKNQLYWVDSEGRLRTVRNNVWYAIHGLDEEKKVKQVVAKTLEQLEQFLKKETKKKEARAVYRLVVQKIFSERSAFSRMSQGVFDRGGIERGSKLEALLAPEVVSTRKRLKETESWPSKEQHEKALMDAAYAEFQFAQRLGIDLVRVSKEGSGGARFALDRDRRKLFVIKPGDEGPGGANNPQWYARLKRLFVTPKFGLEGNSEPLAELDSWAMDRKFGIWAVPPTEVREVESRSFVGKVKKQCSVQMYVEGCQSLGDFLGIPYWAYGFPRPFLRWYLGRENKRMELLAKLPPEEIQAIALHNFLIEDLDSHLDNFLVRPFSSESHQTDLFQKHVVQLLAHTSDSKGNHEKVLLVKHDGGASHPHHHPYWWEFLALRFKHLFEVLPHFDEHQFSDQVKPLFERKGAKLDEFLHEKGKRELKNVMDLESFEAFWSAYSNEFQSWAKEKDPKKEKELRLKLIDHLFTSCQGSVKLKSKYKTYFNYHLKRINGSLGTRRESFEVMQNHFKREKNDSKVIMRDLFLTRTSSDFKKVLKKAPKPKKVKHGLPKPA